VDHAVISQSNDVVAASPGSAIESGEVCGMRPATESISSRVELSTGALFNDSCSSCSWFWWFGGGVGEGVGDGVGDAVGCGVWATITSPARTSIISTVAGG
jgi:hypothetical protein